MDYTESFNQTIFNPLVKDLFKTYPRLKDMVKEYPSLSDKEWEKVFRYIIACYDPLSPLRKDFTSLPRCKEESAILAGFDLKRDNAFLQKLYECSNETIVEVINEYLKQVNSRVYAMIISATELFWEFNTRITTKINEDRDKDGVAAVNMKSKMVSEIEIISNQIDRLTKQFYGDDTLENEVKKVRITPETIAKRKELIAV